MANTVLYVDDEWQLPAQSAEVLAQAGYELIHTADPEEALRIARQAPPALVLAEVLLAGCDGLELIEKLGSGRAGSPLPIVVVTRGERTPQVYGRALELGVKDFLCKPVLRAQVLEAVLAFARSEEAGAPAPPPEESFAGDLGEEPFPELLAWLHRTGASGVLELQAGAQERLIEFRNGSPVEVARHRKLASIGDHLLQTGRIDAEQHDLLVDQLMARIAGPREILLGMDALSEAELESATREQARGVLLEIFRWPAGRFVFRAGQRLPVGKSLSIACDPSELLFAGVQCSPDDVIHRALARRSDLYLSQSEAAAVGLDGAGLTPEQRSDVESLDGACTLAEVLAASSIEERTVYALVVTGAVALEERPILLLEQAVKPDEPDALYEPEEAAELAATEEPAFPFAAGPGEAPRPPEPASRQRPALASVASAIEAIARRVKTEDDFEVFGIDENTRDADVRSAYSALLESLRLDHIPRDLDELRALALDLRTRLQRAYERVRSEDLRRAFAGLRKKKRVERREEAGGSRAVEAESWFRKGEDFLAADRFEQAVEAFGMSVHLDPAQGEYTAYLGYAMHRSNPRSPVIRREALEHVAKGVKLAPDREKPLLFLARIFRESGDGPMAAKVLRRALQLNPDSPALVQEMCLIHADGTGPRRRSLIEKLRGH